MPWYEIVFDIILGVLFIAGNIMYAMHGARSFRDVQNFHAFTDIWHVTEMNVFGKIICSVFTGVFCCVGIFVLYAAKFIYWAFHYKKEG